MRDEQVDRKLKIEKHGAEISNLKQRLRQVQMIRLFPLLRGIKFFCPVPRLETPELQYHTLFFVVWKGHFLAPPTGPQAGAPRDLVWILGKHLPRYSPSSGFAQLSRSQKGNPKILSSGGCI